MAAFTKTESGLGRYAHLHSWTLTTADGTGDALELPGSADRAVQFVDSTWGGATVVLEGSIDGTNFVTLVDPLGNDITATSGSPIFAVLANVRYIQPRLSVTGTGATVPVYLLSKTG